MNKKRRNIRSRNSFSKKAKISLINSFSAFSKGKYKRRNKNNSAVALMFSLLSLIKNNFVISIFAGLCIFCIIWTLIIFSSNIFLVSQLYIQRQDSLINIEKAYSTMNYVRWKNIFFIDKNNVRERVINSQWSTKNVNVNIDLPSTLNIFIEAYSPVFQTSSQYILENGILIDKSGNNIYDIPSLTLINTQENNKSLNIENLESAKILIETLKKNILGINIQDILYYEKEWEVLIIGENSNIYIFDLAADVTAQVKRLAIYNQDQSDITDSRYVYIDVRVSWKLFLCRYEAEFSCLENLTRIYSPELINLRKKESSETPQ